MTASMPTAMTAPVAAAAMPAMPSTATAMPAMSSTAATAAMTTVTSAPAPARAEFVGRMQQTIGLYLERSSSCIRILRRLRDRHCSTERQRCSEHDCNRFHFFVLLFAGISPAQPI
jgi:hypothetical protein